MQALWPIETISKKWSNLGFGKERRQALLAEVHLMHLIGDKMRKINFSQ